MKNLMSEQHGGVEPLLLSDTSDSNESPERLLWRVTLYALCA